MFISRIFNGFNIRDNFSVFLQCWLVDLYLRFFIVIRESGFWFGIRRGFVVGLLGFVGGRFVEGGYVDCVQEFFECIGEYFQFSFCFGDLFFYFGYVDVNYFDKGCLFCCRFVVFYLGGFYVNLRYIFDDDVGEVVMQYVYKFVYFGEQVFQVYVQGFGIRSYFGFG